MTEPTSLQSVLRAHLARYSSTRTLSPRQWQICHHILDCRTAAMGGQRLACDQCDSTRLYYHACRDRHCPRCQRRASEHWCERQRANVLPVTYYHMVFTLPHELNGWVEVHPRQIYALLFESVWATMRAFGEDPKRLNGQIGMSAMLHTWGQNLSRHVHLHCLVPGGALTKAGQWCAATSTYLFPVRALSRHVRGGFVSRLRQAIHRGELHRLTDSPDAMLTALMAKDWVVYAKPCLTRTETVIDYLGRYSHRIALSDARLIGNDGEQIALRYKDYRDNGTNKVMQLSGEELIRRFLLHVLPKGLMRIRHYGYLANRCRAQRLITIRKAIAEQRQQPILAPPGPPEKPSPLQGCKCTACQPGWLYVVALVRPRRDPGGGLT
jgi:hypothetical protein